MGYKITLAIVFIAYGYLNFRLGVRVGYSRMILWCESKGWLKHDEAKKIREGQSR